MPWLADIAFMAELLRSLGVETGFVRGAGWARAARSRFARRI